MKDHNWLIVGAMIVIGLCLACLIAGGFSLWRTLQQLDDPPCPPMLVYEDANGNGQQDTGEFGLTNTELGDISVEFFDDQGRSLKKTSFLGCFMPVGTKGTLRMVIHLPPELRATSPLEYNIDVIYAMDTFVPVGVQRR